MCCFSFGKNFFFMLEKIFQKMSDGIQSESRLITCIQHLYSEVWGWYQRSAYVEGNIANNPPGLFGDDNDDGDDYGDVMVMVMVMVIMTSVLFLEQFMIYNKIEGKV